jgi:energy-coupling factor transporter transmembrane protein EcfT
MINPEITSKGLSLTFLECIHLTYVGLLEIIGLGLYDAQTQKLFFMKSIKQILALIALLFFCIFTHYLIVMGSVSLFVWDIVYKIDYENVAAAFAYFITLLTWIIFVFVVVSENEDFFD